MEGLDSKSCGLYRTLLPYFLEKRLEENVVVYLEAIFFFITFEHAKTWAGGNDGEN